MSVRRLAEASVQPASFAFSKANASWARQTIRKYPKGREQSAVIPLLMRAQEQEGWVSQAAIEHVAEMLEMPKIRVLEVATFYTQYQLKPVGRRAHVQVCGTTPCMLRGSEKLMDVCRSKIHHEQFHTNESGTLSWEEVECLGACVNAPMVMIFKDTYEDLTPEKLGEIIAAFDAGKGASVVPGPQNGRRTSEPLTAQTTLIDERIVLKSTRDREAKAAAKASKAGTDATVPPTRAARPKTSSMETNPAFKSPSKTKTDPNVEKRASVETPAVNKAAADRAAPEVEKADKPRHHARPATDNDKAQRKSPKLLEGEPIGPGGKRRPGEKAAPKGKPSPDGKLATRASRAKKPREE